MTSVFSRVALILTLLVAAGSAAHADGHGGGGGGGGHGPDAWRVHGVNHYDSLNVRVGPGTNYFAIDALPHNARGIQVSYCTPTVTQQQYYALTYQQQHQLNQYPTWCLVSWNGYQRGWVNRRFLTEDGY